MEPSGRKLKKKDDEQSLAVEPCINQHKKEISVTIKTMTGKRFPVSADPNDPIRILKMQIEKSEGMEKRLQKLMFTGRVLENAKTLNDYNLKEGDLIYLLKRNLKTSKGPNSAADSEDEDDDDDDDDEDDHDDDQIPIEIIYDKKALFKINVDREDSISDVKEKIWQNVDSNDLSLIYGGQKVEDSKTVKDYNYFKKLKLDISGDINLKIAPDFPVNVICQQVPYQTSVRSTMPVKEFRSLVSGMVKYPFILMCNRRILVDDKASLGSYDIKKPENILVIPESNGGNCLKFMLAIEKAETNGVDQLRESLNFLEDQETLNLIFSEGLKSIKAIKNYNTYKPEELLAVKLFTSDVLQKQLNDCLDNNKDLARWSIYLKNFIKGLKHIDYYRGLAYRAIKDSQNTANYQKGAKISWKSIPGLTRSKEEAKELAGSNGTIIEIDVVSARNISELSFSSTEQIVLLPYSCFEVMEVINNPNQPLVIKLREIPIPRAAKVLFWVDDNPEYNYHYAKSVEEKGTSVVFCTSTKDALDVIESYKWLLSLDSTNFRVVSDMVRYENGVPQYTAGIDLLKALFNVYKYCFPVMIFCNNVQKAQENAKAANLHGHYQIANQDYQLEAYIYF